MSAQTGANTAEDQEKPAETETPVEAPMLEETDPPKSFFTEVQQDPNIRKFGKFHIRQVTVYWALSKNSFEIPFYDAETGEVTSSKVVHFECSTIFQQVDKVRRLIFGKLIVYVG